MSMLHGIDTLWLTIWNPYSTAMTVIAVFALMLSMVLFCLLKRKLPEASRQGIHVDEALDAMQVALWEWDWEKNQIAVNDAWLAMHGYTRNEIEPITYEVFMRLVHPEDLKTLEDSTKLLQSGTVESVEVLYRINRRDGMWIWITSRATVISRRKDGTPQKIIGGIIDVSKAMAKEREKNDYHQIMEYVIKHSKSGIAVMDKDLRYVFVSEAFHEIYGINPTNAVGRRHYDDFPDLPQKYKDAHQKALKGQISHGDRDPYPRANGSVDYTRWECRPWYDASGIISGIVVYTEVITDQIQRELDLEKSRNFLKLVMDHLPIGISLNTTHPAVEFSYMNDLFAQIYGTTNEALQKKDGFWEAVYEEPAFRDEIRQRVLTDIESGDKARFKWENVPLTRKGKPTRYINAFMTQIPESNLVISTVIDVTDLNVRRLESEFNSTHDFLTGLRNRRQFSNDLDEWNIGFRGNLTLMMLDINGLKIINDTFGFIAGDEVLKHIGAILKRECEGFGTPYRIGGDEFAILLGDKTTEQTEALKQLIAAHVSDILDANIPISIAIGHATKKADDEDISLIIKEAESFMYKQKILDGRSHRNSAIKGILQTLTDKYEIEKRHSEGVSRFAVAIGEALELPNDDVRELKLAGMLHDIGKITVPDAILSKPGKLDADEYEAIKNHASRGYQILRAADEYSDLAIYCLTHHERYDGSGYPSGLKGEKIPLFSRIIAVADAFEAMTSRRPYRQPFTFEVAAAELSAHRGTQFDPKIVDVFLKILPSLQE
jgi:diguanylate cyclase (GGDEF)-like protein/PAS domain S-box-containing protein